MFTFNYYNVPGNRITHTETVTTEEAFLEILELNERDDYAQIVSGPVVNVYPVRRCGNV